MEGSDTSASLESNPGFNSKRALGRDKDDGDKKNLQLKVRKLNPVNTICYVQVIPPSGPFAHIVIVIYLNSCELFVQFFSNAVFVA